MPSEVNQSHRTNTAWRHFCEVTGSPQIESILIGTDFQFCKLISKKIHVCISGLTNKAIT